MREWDAEELEKEGMWGAELVGQGFTDSITHSHELLTSASVLSTTAKGPN